MQTELNILNLVLISAIIIGGFLGISFIYMRNGNRQANRILGALLLGMSGLLALALFLNRQLTFDCPHLFSAATPIPLLFGPLLYLYVRSKVSDQHTLSWKDGLHLLPFIILLCSQFIFSMLPLGSRINLAETIVQDAFFVNYRMIILNTTKILFNLGYIWITLRLINDYQNIKKQNSKLFSVQSNWLKNLTYFIGFYWLAYTGVFIYQTSINVDMLYVDNFLSVSLSFVTLGIGFIAIQKPMIYSGDLRSETGNSKYERSALNQNRLKSIERKLNDEVEKNQIYLKNDLVLQDLADNLGVPAHYISQTLSQQMNTNFFDFINRHRISHSKKLLVDPDFEHYTILAVAEESGFNSKASFNRSFKKFTGVTPSQYVKRTNGKS